MKNTILFLCVAALSILSLTTNAQAFQEGNRIISAGYGISTTGRAVLKSLEMDGADIDITGHNPIYGKFEYAITDKWGIGVNYFNSSIGFKQSYTTETVDGSGNLTTKEYTDEYAYKVQAFSVRFNRHWEVTDEFDVYFGFGGGPKFGKLTAESDNPDFEESEFSTPFPFAMECTMGARYYFTPNIGIYTEIGMARSFMQGGLVVKF
jgi:Outer membrane protein beta-barrel domain